MSFYTIIIGYGALTTLDKIFPSNKDYDIININQPEIEFHYCDNYKITADTRVYITGKNYQTKYTVDRADVAKVDSYLKIKKGIKTEKLEQYLKTLGLKATLGCFIYESDKESKEEMV